MRKYKMIALAYNGASTSIDAFDEVFDSSNGFLQEGDKLILSRKTKLLDDLKKHAENNTEQNNCVLVTRLKYDINKPAEYDQLLGRVYNAIKKTDMALIVLLECDKEASVFNLQDFQCEYGTDGGLEMFFDLIVVEEENEGKIKTRILKNKFGGLDSFTKWKEAGIAIHINDFFRMCDLKNVAKNIVLYAQLPEENYAKVLECYTILVDAYLSKDDLEIYVDRISAKNWGYDSLAACNLYNKVYYQRYVGVIDDEKGEIHRLLQSEELTNVTPIQFIDNFLKERRKSKNKE
jgi:hypothetical protein